MYDPITIFLIVLGLFLVGLFLFLCFLLREVPLTFVVKFVWWCWIVLIFACLWNFCFLCQIWMTVLLGILGKCILGCRFFPFIILNRSFHSLSVCRVSLEKSVDNLMGVPLCVTYRCSLVASNILSLSWIFVIWLLCVSACSSLSLSCLGFSVLPGIGWLFPSHVREVFSYCLFKCFLEFFLFLFFFWDPYKANVGALYVVPEDPIRQMLGHSMLSQRPLGHLHFCSFFFYTLFCGSDFRHSVL